MRYVLICLFAIGCKGKNDPDQQTITCTPQPNFASRTVVADHNYYDYRNGKAFLDFDSSTGIYRRLVLAEGVNGEPAYTKLQGCYYQRTGEGVDASFGKQLLLDTDIKHIISGQYFDPLEIFTYTESGPDLNMNRFDDIAGYNYTFCPYLNTPYPFCLKLKTPGNNMFFPNLPAADQTALTNEAILISKQHNWTASSKANFDNMWKTIDSSRISKTREDYKYDVIIIPDTPYYITDAWREYIMGNRPFMVDVTTSNSLNICYPGYKNITLDDGSTGKIFGEICYISGVYSFTQN